MAHGAWPCINARDAYDDTPVHLAEEEGYVDIVRLLLEHRAMDPLPLPPLDKDLRDRLRSRAEDESEGGPWNAILADFGTQFATTPVGLDGVTTEAESAAEKGGERDGEAEELWQPGAFGGGSDDSLERLPFC